MFKRHVSNYLHISNSKFYKKQSLVISVNFPLTKRWTVYWYSVTEWRWLHFPIEFVLYSHGVCSSQDDISCREHQDILFVYLPGEIYIHLKIQRRLGISLTFVVALLSQLFMGSKWRQKEREQLPLSITVLRKCCLSRKGNVQSQQATPGLNPRIQGKGRERFQEYMCNKLYISNAKALPA